MKRNTGHRDAGLRRRVGADTPCRSTRRAFLIALGAGALAAPFASFGQQRPKVFRIGFLGSTSATGYAGQIEGLRLGLRELGYIEGKNLVIEFRWAEGKYDRLPELAAELVRLKVDLIVTHGSVATPVARQATTTIPIVMGIIGDPVALGLVASLRRPGGNITGLTFFVLELMAKRLELLKDALPRTERVAVLFNRDNIAKESVFQSMLVAAKSLKMELQQFEVGGPDEFASTFSAMAGKRVNAVVIFEDAMLIANVRPAVSFAAKYRIPAIGFIEVAQAGGLMAYGVNFPTSFRHAAVYVDKILKGANPGDLPIERATTFELVVNLKTAKALGITIPQSILVRADRVIE